MWAIELPDWNSTDEVRDFCWRVLADIYDSVDGENIDDTVQDLKDGLQQALEERRR